MTRERFIWLLALASLVVGAWWLSVNTEWVEEDRSRGAQGEARDNPVYAFEQLLRRLGMTVSHHESLDALPPPHARLVLLSSDWELMPARGEQLHRWVQQGGHLVLPHREGWEDTMLARWVPVDELYAKSFEPQKRSRTPSKPGAAASAARAPDAARTELASNPPLWGDTEYVAACHAFQPGWNLRAKPGHTAAWSLTLVDGTRATQALVAQQARAIRELVDKEDKAEGKPERVTRPVHPAIQVLRVPVGQGSVTVLNTDDRIFYNPLALDCEHPLLLAGVLQAEPGSTAWIYLHEKREGLLRWLWHTGWIALVAGALALTAALWRGAVRFGPRLAAAPRLRRSISEQVRGLGAYLQRDGREALLAAQQRALHEAASRHLPRYARLTVTERARAIAAATGLAADELVAALAAKFCTRAELLKHLPVLEAARRRLHRTPEERHSPS